MELEFELDVVENMQVNAHVVRWWRQDSDKETGSAWKMMANFTGSKYKKEGTD